VAACRWPIQLAKDSKARSTAMVGCCVAQQNGLALATEQGLRNGGGLRVSPCHWQAAIDNSARYRAGDIGQRLRPHASMRRRLVCASGIAQSARASR